MPNLYRQFLDLLPPAPLQVGDVTAVDAAGATVALIGGGTLRVRGDAQVGDRVFVRDGVIEGPAPTLTAVTIEV